MNIIGLFVIFSAISKIFTEEGFSQLLMHFKKTKTKQRTENYIKICYSKTENSDNYLKHFSYNSAKR